MEEQFLRRIGNDLQYAGYILSDGRDEIYLVPLPEEVASMNQHSHMPVLNDFEEILRQSDIVETEVYKNEHQKIIVRKSQRQLDNIISWRVFRRDGFACRYCGDDTVPLTYDHALLWEKGGPNTEENGLTACKRCNKKRGNTDLRQWLNSDYYQFAKRGISIPCDKANWKVVEEIENGNIKPVFNQRSR